MHKKRFIGFFVLFLLVFSTFTFAADETTSSDCGFWCKASQFLWGNPDNWVGRSWFDFGVAGK